MKTESGHYYSRDGKPAHWVEKKDGSGNRPTTIADARKQSLLPSPTTVLKLLAKPALIDWMIRTAVHAVVTAPDAPNEGLDAKITRVLDEERQQDQESQMAKDLGTSIHEAIEQAISGQPWNPALKVFVDPVMGQLAHIGRCVASEKVLVAQDHAGKVDCICESDYFITVVDFKSSKKLPDKGPYIEHRLQAASYAASIGFTGEKRVHALIIYISTTEPGRIKVCMVDDWERDYKMFRLILEFWYLSNNYDKPTAGRLPF